MRLRFVLAAVGAVALLAPAAAGAVTYECPGKPCRAVRSTGPVPSGAVIKLKIVEVAEALGRPIPFGIHLSQRSSSVVHKEGEWIYDPNMGHGGTLPKNPVGATITHRLKQAGPISWGLGAEVRRFEDKGPFYRVTWFLWTDPVSKKDMTVTIDAYK